MKTNATGENVQTVIKIEIESGVTLTPINRGSTSPYVEALKSMQVGNAFKAPKSSLQTIRAHAKKNGISIATRATEDEKVVRIFRVKDEVATAPAATDAAKSE